MNSWQPSPSSSAPGPGCRPERMLGYVLMLGLLSGCVSPSRVDTALGPAYRPENIHCVYPVLPDQIRRVAVLPISVDQGDWQAAQGTDGLQPILYSEFGKIKKFELVTVRPEQIRRWTGATTWRATEALPDNLLAELQQKLRCDAILFSHLRPFHAYRPIIVGWNLKLVECRTQQIFWAADEVFDASDERVVRSAQRYSQQHGESWWQPLADPASILSSPRQFSQYTLSALFATLPER